MSWHCLFCGEAEEWMRGKERTQDFGMIEIFVSNGTDSEKTSLGVAHADCFKRILKTGQNRYMQDGELSEFEKLDKFMKGE